MEVYRIVNEKYADGLFASGRAGRWNQTDEFIIYTSSSRALATLELLVHQANVKPAINYKVLVIEIPDNHSMIESKALPQNWHELAAYYHLQSIGSQWYSEKSSVVLSVPSAVIPQERNFLINTKHPDFSSKVKLKAVEEYFWDSRI